MVFIDQHAAHERILFEQLKSKFEESIEQTKPFQLTKPIIIDLPFLEVAETLEYLRSIHQIGFEVEKFTDSTYRVNAVPEILKDQDIRSLIFDMIEQLQESKTITFSHTPLSTMLSFLACRAAIKAGDKLTVNEAQRLVNELEQTSNNPTCPHGRPTKIVLSLDELHKLFKRK